MTGTLGGCDAAPLRLLRQGVAHARRGRSAHSACCAEIQKISRVM